MLLTLAVASAAVLAGALAQSPAKPQPPKPAPAAEPAKPAVADPEAKKTLDEAVKALDRNQLKWVETMLWQQVDVQGLVVQSEGIYLAGPDYRVHLNLKVRAGDAAGKMEFICDGTTLWEVMQFGEAKPTITKREIKGALDKLNGPAVTPELRDQYLQRWAFAGIAPLVKGLQHQMVFTKRETARWQDHDVIKLTGTWSADMVKQITPDPKTPWPAYLPRQCVLYLDAKSSWPHRLEWWGPSPPLQTDALLLQMEFRNPKFAEMSSDRCAKVFSFTAGKDAVDQTSQLIQELNARIAELKK
jgi:hypothetical protein